MSEKEPIVIDQIGDEQILTWEEASSVTTKRAFIPKYGKYIVYRTSIPLDVMGGISARYPGKAQNDVLGRLTAMLEYVMVSPALKTPESKRAVLKADSAVLLEVINDVTPRGERDEYKNSLAGESQPS